MAKTLNELLKIINATDPDSGEEFLKLLEPQKYDRIEMGSIMEATLGNDLTCYYDKKDIADYLEFITNYEPSKDDSDSDDGDNIDLSEVKDFIRDNKEDIIEESYKLFMETHPVYIHAAVENYLEEMTGVDVTTAIGDKDFEFTFEDDDEESDEDPDDISVDEDEEE